MNDLLDLMGKRFSVRSFSSTPVEEEKLERILEAGRLAPTAMNCQPQRILLLQSPEALKKAAECTTCHYGAPTVLLISYDRGESAHNPYDDRDLGSDDASIVITHMMLEAAALGLGSCWIARLDTARARAAFSLPEELCSVAMLYIGYPAADCVPAARHSQRKPLSETVTRL